MEIQPLDNRVLVQLIDQTEKVGSIQEYIYTIIKTECPVCGKLRRLRRYENGKLMSCNDLTCEGGMNEKQKIPKEK